VAFGMRKRDQVELNLTPLIDVVFLLLIFFMVSTSFTRETQVVIDLPEAAGQKSDRQPEVLEISVSSLGDYYINGAPLIDSKRATLLRGVEQAAGNNFSKQVVISGDKGASYQSLITVLDVAGSLGFANITLASRMPKPEQ